MKWKRFLYGVAAGLLVTYFISQKRNHPFITPEKIIHSLKNRYKDKMSIIGSWIHVEPQLEKLDGSDYYTYQAGLTGIIDGEPTFLEFKIDAETGHLINMAP